VAGDVDDLIAIGVLDGEELSGPIESVLLESGHGVQALFDPVAEAVPDLGLFAGVREDVVLFDVMCHVRVLIVRVASVGPPDTQPIGCRHPELYLYFRDRLDFSPLFSGGRSTTGIQSLLGQSPFAAALSSSLILVS